MFRILTSTIFLLGMLGCGQSTTVLSEDGTTVLRTCRDEDMWNAIPPAADCLGDACPHGLFVLPKKKEARGAPVVRCLPAPPSEQVAP